MTSFATYIPHNAIRVGDIVNVLFREDDRQAMYLNEEVKRVGFSEVETGNCTFPLEDFNFYLAIRPIRPLPTRVGTHIRLDGRDYFRARKVDLFGWVFLDRQGKASQASDSYFDLKNWEEIHAESQSN